MEIKTEKELNKILNSDISVPVYWSPRDIDGTGTRIDEEAMRDEFEEKLKAIITAVNNF